MSLLRTAWPAPSSCDPYDWASRDTETWHAPTGSRPHAPEPGASYSKRSTYIHDIRAWRRKGACFSCEDACAPSDRAEAAAEMFVNNLPEACLDFRLAISMSGEINFFYGTEGDIFQILIDRTGMLSYYGMINGVEQGESDIESAQFPYMKLLSIVDRNK